MKVIRWFGLCWALLGFANIFLMPWSPDNQTLLTVGLIFNGVLFLLPGLALYVIATPKVPPR